MEAVKREYTMRTSTGTARQWSWLSCPRCRGVISVETPPDGEIRVIRVVPNEGRGLSEVNHLPDDVQEYFTNAQTVLQAGLPSSAAVELRRTLEAAAQHQGVNERTLVQSIQKLAEKGLITPIFVGVLGHIRKIGNTGAHASDQKPTQEEVERALAFTTQVLRNLFEIPKELELLGKPEVSITENVEVASTT